MHMLVRRWYVVMAALVLLATVLEGVRCATSAFPHAVRQSDLSNYFAIKRAFGRPDYEILLRPQPTVADAGRVVDVSRAPNIPAAVRASVWDRACFCVLHQRLVIISELRDGRVILSGGQSRNMFPTVVIREDAFSHAR